MPEPRLEEGDRRGDEGKAPIKKSNPLQSFLSRKIKIGGREIPMPLIVLGALGVGIVLFTVIGKKRSGNGGGEGVQTAEDQPDFGFSEKPSLSERAEGSMADSAEDFQTDFGAAISPPTLFEPQPIAIEPISPLPIPELPYSGFGSGIFEPAFTPAPFEQPQYFQPIEIPQTLPQIPQSPFGRIRSFVGGGTKGKQVKQPIQPPIQVPRTIPIIGGTKGKLPKTPQRPVSLPAIRPPVQPIRTPIRPPTPRPPIPIGATPTLRPSPIGGGVRRNLFTRGSRRIRER